MKMKRLVILAIAVVGFGFIVGGTLTYAQSTFSIPFKFKAGGKTYAAGEYSLVQKGEGQVALRKDPGDEEVLIPFTERLPQPETPIIEPQLVFDVVGNFEPSYTEYVTEYVLAEFWLPGEEGFLIHTTKGAHQNQTVKGKPLKIDAHH
jgi:hypothetical protein